MGRGRKLFGHYDDEMAVIEVIFLKWRSRPHGKPMTYESIAASMNENGFTTQKGGPWYPIAIRRIIVKGLQYYRDRGGKPRNEPDPEKKKVRPKTQLGSNDYLTKEQIIKCRAVLRDSDRVLFETLIGSGLRAAECCDLEVRDIAIFDGKQLINVRHGKGDRVRAITITERLKNILWLHLCGMGKGRDTIASANDKTPLFTNRKGMRLTYSNLYDRISKVRDRSGVPCLHPHALRHTFGVFLYNYKKDLDYVRRQLGHASIATTQIYINALSVDGLEQMRGFEKSMEP